MLYLKLARQLARQFDLKHDHVGASLEKGESMEVIGHPTAQEDLEKEK